MATSIDQTNFVKTALRLPPELHESLHAAAQSSGRSYNAQIIETLQQAEMLGAERDALVAEVRSLTQQVSRSMRLLADYQAMQEAGSKRISELKSEIHEIKMSNAGPDHQILIGSLKVQQRYIRVLGMYLKELAARVPPTDDQMTRKLLAALISMGEQLDVHEGHIGFAHYELGQLHSLGLTTEAFIGPEPAPTKTLMDGQTPKPARRTKAKKP